MSCMQLRRTAEAPCAIGLGIPTTAWMNGGSAMRGSDIAIQMAASARRVGCLSPEYMQSGNPSHRS
eukprot:2646433-Prymnesium_polylepis.2